MGKAFGGEVEIAARKPHLGNLRRECNAGKNGKNAAVEGRAEACTCPWPVCKASKDVATTR